MASSTKQHSNANSNANSNAANAQPPPTDEQSDGVSSPLPSNRRRKKSNAAKERKKLQAELSARATKLASAEYERRMSLLSTSEEYRDASPVAWPSVDTVSSALVDAEAHFMAQEAHISASRSSSWLRRPPPLPPPTATESGGAPEREHSHLQALTYFEKVSPLPARPLSANRLIRP